MSSDRAELESTLQSWAKNKAPRELFLDCSNPNIRAALETAEPALRNNLLIVNMPWFADEGPSPESDGNVTPTRYFKAVQERKGKLQGLIDMLTVAGITYTIHDVDFENGGESYKAIAFTINPHQPELAEKIHALNPLGGTPSPSAAEAVSDPILSADHYASLISDARLSANRMYHLAVRSGLKERFEKEIDHKDRHLLGLTLPTERALPDPQLKPRASAVIPNNPDDLLYELVTQTLIDRNTIERLYTQAENEGLSLQLASELARGRNPTD